jgi:hypothetical protein
MTENLFCLLSQTSDRHYFVIIFATSLSLTMLLRVFQSAVHSAYSCIPRITFQNENYCDHVQVLQSYLVTLGLYLENFIYLTLIKPTQILCTQI